MVYYKYYLANFCAYGIEKDQFMDIFKVSLFGHREIESLREIDELLIPRLKKLISSHEFTTFFIGRSGEFDEYAASIIKKLCEVHGEEKTELTLVIPYPVSRLEDYDKYYDSIIIPESLSNAHPKAAITLRNRWMIDNSDLVIVYVKRKFGGAYEALRYAQRTNKKIIDLCKVHF